MKPRLIYITPTFPALGGHGGAMRAAVFLESLSRHYDVSLVVINLWNRNECLSQVLRSKCVSVQTISIEELEALRTLRKNIVVPQQGVSHIHVYRLQMVPFVIQYLDRFNKSRPLLTLDFDDFESKLTRQMAELEKANGNTSRAQLLFSRSHRFEILEKASLPKFDQVYVCHDRDKQDVSAAYACSNIHVVPNVVRMPTEEPPMPVEVPLIIQFLGTLDYLPNEDAARWLCEEIVPLIKKRTRLEFQIRLVGSRPSASVRRLHSPPLVTVLGPVAIIDEVYRDVAVSIVPIRVAGGTRIKILEALSYKRAVVTTSIGADGLAVRNGMHLLIGDTAEELAERCSSLLNDSLRRTTLGEQGFEWVAKNYTLLNALKIMDNNMVGLRTVPHRPADHPTLNV